MRTDARRSFPRTATCTSSGSTAYRDEPPDLGRERLRQRRITGLYASYCLHGELSRITGQSAVPHCRLRDFLAERPVASDSALPEGVGDFFVQNWKH
jgi:hypothetical protein